MALKYIAGVLELWLERIQIYKAIRLAVLAIGKHAKLPDRYTQMDHNSIGQHLAVAFSLLDHLLKQEEATEPPPDGRR